jgi:hypothetical protein
MQTLRVTPNRMSVDRLFENEQYISNSYWFIDKTKVNKSFDDLRAKANEIIDTMTLERSNIIINRALDNNMEILSWNEIFTQVGIEDPENVISDIPYTYMFNSKGEKTKLNGYFVTYFKKLGAVKFEQSQTFKNNPVIAKNDKNEFIGMIMPVRF